MRLAGVRVRATCRAKSDVYSVAHYSQAANVSRAHAHGWRALARADAVDLVDAADVRSDLRRSRAKFLATSR